MPQITSIIETVRNQVQERETGCLSMASERSLADALNSARICLEWGIGTLTIDERARWRVDAERVLAAIR